MKLYLVSMTEVPKRPPVLLGRIVGAYGIKGWISVHSFTEIPSTIGKHNCWLVGEKDHWQRYTLLSFKEHGRSIVVQLKGCVDRDSAEALKGLEIAVNYNDLPALSSGEYYWSDLQGKTVVNTQGVEYGRVSQLMATGANDVLVVTPQSGLTKEEILIPYIDEVIVDVDLQNNLIRVDWELNY